MRDVRGKEMSERLTRLLVDNENGRNLEVEECARNTSHAVQNVHATLVLRDSLGQITLKVRGAILVCLDLHVRVNTVAACHEESNAHPCHPES